MPSCVASSVFWAWHGTVKSKHKPIKRYATSFGIKVDHIADSLLACGTELRSLIGTHAAVWISAVDSFQRIARSFIEADLLVFADQVFPFVVEIDFSRDVFLPWFYIVRIHRDLLFFISIFIGETGKAMPEFMYHDRAEPLMVGAGENIGIEDATATITVGIDKNEDMLIGRTGKSVVYELEFQSGKITFAIECIEVRS